MNNDKTAAKEDAHMSSSEADRDFVPQTCADLAKAGYGFFHQFSDSAQHLYLVSGEVYRVGESDLTRIK